MQLVHLIVTENALAVVDQGKKRLLVENVAARAGLRVLANFVKVQAFLPYRLNFAAHVREQENIIQNSVIVVMVRGNMSKKSHVENVMVMANFQ
jgi:hypothetical protein